jgi:hypothetical protein
MVKAVVADEARIKAFEDGVASSGAPRSQVTLPPPRSALPIASQAVAVAVEVDA